MAEGNAVPLLRQMPEEAMRMAFDDLPSGAGHTSTSNFDAQGHAVVRRLNRYSKLLTSVTGYCRPLLMADGHTIDLRMSTAHARKGQGATFDRDDRLECEPPRSNASECATQRPGMVGGQLDFSEPHGREWSATPSRLGSRRHNP
eukprot:s3041_g3.t1